MTKRRKKHYKSITKRSFLPPLVREVTRRGGGSEPDAARNIPGCREALSPTACGRSPLAEGAKWGGYGRRFTVTFGVFGSVSRSE